MVCSIPSMRQHTKHTIQVPLVFILCVLAFLLGKYSVSPFNTFASASIPPTQTLGEDTLSFCTLPEVILHGPRSTKKIALTFDADMTYGMDTMLHSGKVNSYLNTDVINILENTQTKATLFLTGLWIQDYPEETKLLAKNSLFELANHSYSHPTFSGYCYGLPGMAPWTMQQQIMKTQELLLSIAGVHNSYFRFPGGCVSSDAMSFLSSQGMKAVNWDVVGDDGFNTNTQGIIDNVVSHIQNGSIIVLHMNGYPNDPKTSEALPVIISDLKAKGYSFVTLSELLSSE